MTRLLLTKSSWVAAGIAALLFGTACGSEDPTPIDSEFESESIQDSQTDTSYETEPVDSEPDPNAACLASISGRVLMEGKEQVPVSVIVCIGICFEPISTKADGSFTWRLPLESDMACAPYDFTATPVHIDFRVPSAKESFAEYAFITVPTMEDIKDQGESDYDLALGDLSLYALPEESAEYTPEGGVDLSLFGVEAAVLPSALVKFDGDDEVPITHNQAVRVFEAPLNEWDPPFVNVDLGALYFLGPRWARLGGDGVSFSINAPLGFEDGDTAVIYLLGSYSSDWGDASVEDVPDFMYLDADGNCVNDNAQSSLTMVADGVFQACGEVTVEGGKIVTPPLPRLTWVGIGR